VSNTKLLVRKSGVECSISVVRSVCVRMAFVMRCSGMYYSGKII